MKRVLPTFQRFAKDPALAAVVESWPALPQALKAGILAMIRSAK